MEDVASSSLVRSTLRAQSFTLGGFIAGEGSFTVTTRQPAYRDGTPRLRFLFDIGIAQRDRALLEQLRDVLGYGSITDRASRREGHLPESTFRIASLRAHKAATIPFCDRYLLPSAKRDQYVLWRDALLWWDEFRPTRYGRGPSPCSEVGCEKPVRGRGLCRSHYYRATGY